MANLTKTGFMDELTRRCGPLRKLGGSQSLFTTRDDTIRVYIRYSKRHGTRTFYGLRQEDLHQLEGRPSVICFLWDGQPDPLIVPFSEYEEVFRAVSPATDGQYKAQVYLQDRATQLYIAQAGRFNVEGNFGWECLETLLGRGLLVSLPKLSHSQTQTLLGAIGAAKGYDVWVPPVDRTALDWSLARSFVCRGVLPSGFERVGFVLQEIDVIWVKRGSGEPRALFEVEHSTPIYSGLLRFNDIHLTAPALRPQFTVVADSSRRPLFVKQLNRPTFQQSGLVELCTFLDYTSIYLWHKRIAADDGGDQ